MKYFAVFKRQKVILLFIVFMLFLDVAHSQEASMDVPTYHPVSPNAASLGNYGLYPVNKNLGKVAVNIPVYNLAVKDLKVPISLSYNTSGIRLNDLASWVGLGWTLNAGGAIIRNTKGLPDKSFAWNITDLRDADFNQNNFIYMLDAARSDDDTSPDQYVLNALGVSGSFYFDQNEGHKAVFEDASIAIKINPVSNDEIHAILEDGTTLVFGKGSDNSNATELTDSNLGFYAMNFISTWYLTEIISRNKKDTISFRYKSRSMSFEYARAESEQSYIKYGIPPTLKVNSGYELARMERKFLDKIIFDNGYIKFESTLDREDLTGDYKLNAVKVYAVDDDAIETLVDEFHFEYDYFERSGGNYSDGYTTSANFTLDQQKKSREKSLKLISIYRSAPTGTVQKHLFFYNGTALPERCTTAQDYWGYCNTNTGSLLQQTDVYTRHNYDFEYVQVGNGNRASNEAKMKAGILEKIIYPTGGHTLFDYEANRTSAGTVVGGLRIKAISNYDGKSTNPTGTKTFEYENANLIHPVGNKRYTRKVVGNNKQSLNVYVSTSPYYNNNLGGEPVIEYGKVTEYDYDSLTDKVNGKTISYYENIHSTQVLNGAVTLTLFKHDQFTVQGTVLNILMDEALSGVDAMNYYETTSWKRAKLKKEEIYKANGSSFTLINYVENKYQTINEDTLYNNYVSSVFETIPYDTWTVPNPYDPSGDYSSAEFCYHVDKTITGRKVLKQTIEKTYDQDGANPVTTTTNFYYDNPTHVQLTRTISVDSKGDILISKTYYPDDVIDETTLPGGDLTVTESNTINSIKSNGLHYVALPIQTESYKDYDADSIGDPNELLSIKRTVYKSWSGSVMPQRVASLTGEVSPSNPLEDRVIFHGYDDKGNPQEVSRADDMHVSYVWAYNNQYPVVKAENISGVSLETAVAAAINSLSGYSNGLNDMDAMLTDISGLDTQTKRDTWSSFNSSLRSQPGMDNVLITTYTVDPLIGMTGQADPSGTTTYYEYDDFERLEAVKDYNTDIVSSYDYNYIPPPELMLSTSTISLPSSSGSTNVSVYSNVSWTVSDNASWITVSPTSGSNDGTVGISYTQNTGAARSATVTVSGQDVQDQYVTVDQASASPTLSLSPNAVSIPYDGSFNVSLTSNTDWHMVYINYDSGSNWIQSSAGSSSGSGDATLYFTASGSPGDTCTIIYETLDSSVTRTISVSLY
ncbi:MAG: BACON domain-containing protein [Cytophagales bacterium]|nr:BACON domain-containing protein [Cytophagales bacterium]